MIRNRDWSDLLDEPATTPEAANQQVQRVEDPALRAVVATALHELGHSAQDAHNGVQPAAGPITITRSSTIVHRTSQKRWKEMWLLLH